MSSTSAARPNYDDLGMSRDILGATWPFTGLAIIVVGIRFYVRRRFSRCWAWDDWIMLLALVFQIVFQAFLTQACIWGFGKSTANLRPEEAMQGQKWNFLAETLGNWVSMLARVSITIMLVRIFGGSHYWFKWYLIIFMVIEVIISLVGFIFEWIQRVPIQSLWDPSVPLQYRLVSREAEEYTNMTFQFLIGISDLTFVLFPVLFIWKMTLPRRQKLGIALLLSTSAITFGAALAKIVIIVMGLRKELSNTTIQYVAAVILLTTSIEQALVIALGCVPAVAPITKLQFPRLSAIGDSLMGILPGSRWSRKSNSSGSNGSRDIEMSPKTSGDGADMRIRPSKPVRSQYDISALHTTKNDTITSASRP